MTNRSLSSDQPPGAGTTGALTTRWEFSDLQRQQFGPGGFSDVVDHVAVIERSLGIYDLAQFTHAQVTP